jgi:hypothetical protein
MTTKRKPRAIRVRNTSQYDPLIRILQMSGEVSCQSQDQARRVAKYAGSLGLIVTYTIKPPTVKKNV